MVEVPDSVLALAEQRARAREAKEWALADQLRAQLGDAGWLVADTAAGFELSLKPSFEQCASLTDIPVPDVGDVEQGAISIDLIVDGWPEDVRACIEALLTHAPTAARINVLDVGNIDGVGEELERLASLHPRIKIWHVGRNLHDIGWANALNFLIRADAAAAHVIIDISTIVTGDAITPLVEALGIGVVLAGWRGVNVNTDDGWRSFVDAEVPGQVDAVLSYLMAVDAHAARETPPSAKAKFYRNADLEWSLMLRAAGGKVVMPAMELPCHQTRHHGYFDTDSDYRERESRKTYDRILQNFRGKDWLLAPRK